jgi:hypothetical protein
MFSKTVRSKPLGANKRAADNRRWRHGYLCASVFLLAGVGATAPAFAMTAYDGSWSVVISTNGGACPSGIRYGVQIINGHVTSGGEGGVSVAGRVAPSGAVSVAVRSGGQWANGSGRLSMTHGGGAWRGQGDNGFCRGTWAAQRISSQSAAAEEPRRPTYDYAPAYRRAMPPGPIYNYAPRYYLPPDSGY